MMVEPNIEKIRGILNPKAGKKRFRLARHAPAAPVDFFVEHYWMVSWDLSGQAPYVQEILPYPGVHLVFEKDKSGIFGVTTGKFSRLLENKGQALGVRFKPGGFYPFVKLPVSRFTDHSIAVEDIFGVEGKRLAEAILSLETEAQRVERVDDFLQRRLPEPDELAALVNQIVGWISANQSVTKVDAVVSQFNLSKRSLQRLFSQYVGVSPKWVIKRSRLQEAAARMVNGDVVDWPGLAVELGYFDQAHFIKEFKAIVGTSPTEYARRTA